MSIYKNTLARTVMTLFMILAMTLSASATDFITDFITDVMLLGDNDQTTFNSQLSDLTDQGWLDINYDMNAGCGSNIDHIHLLYRKQSSSGNTGVPITDFYIRTGDNPPSSLTYDGRTYYLVPCQGSDSFINSQGDLNHNAGGDYIYLYYTKDALTINHGVTEIYFNYLQYGAVGANGGSTGYNLNAGCSSSSDYVYMHITTTAGANVVTLSSGSGEVQLLNGHILTGTGGANTKVTITDGATVTLSDVNITAIADDSDHRWSGISCWGNAVIVLGEGTTNTVKGGIRSSGIYVPDYNTLTIQGGGTLNATGAWGAAGIGSGYGYSYCGNITIKGGTVNATGGASGAGIGSGCGESSCGIITISGGVVNAVGGDGAAGIGSGYDQSDCYRIYITQGVTRVTATKGGGCNNAIGAGANNSTCGSVTIGDVETGFITKSPFTTFPYTVAFNANGGTGVMANMNFMYNVAQLLFANFFTCTGFAFDGWATTPDGPKVYNDEQSVSNLTETSGATVTLYARWIAPKAIAGYGTGNGGWKLIASPVANAVTPTADNGFLANTYDLYYFDQTGGDNGKEWKNYKAHCNDAVNPFNALASGQGYLYANSGDVTLIFNGTPYSGNGQVTLTKTDGFEFSGWNLIGNPFGTAKTLGSKPFYRMNDLGTEIIAATIPTIAAMEGIFVVANTNGETVTFAESTKDHGSEERIIINLCNNAAVIDRAIIRLGEGETLPKFQLRDNSTKIYIPQDGKDYAVVNADATGEMPVNFKAHENGIYTLTISTPLTSNLSPLTLIDNLTGANIDLLTTPSYTFEAQTTDYASRFRLVFGASDTEEVFAFVSDGQLIVNGEGTLQIFDVLGHQLFAKQAPLTSNLSPLTSPGVYVLRLINGAEVKTQKIFLP